jgi:hypothetical protein
MLKLKKILLISLLFLFLAPVHLVQGQEDMTDTVLEDEMENQRASYQQILKRLKAEEFLESADITQLINSGEINIDMIEKTVRNLQEKQANNIYGEVKQPTMTSLMSGGAHKSVITLLAPLEKVSEEQLKNNLTKNLKNGVIKRFIDGHDNFKNFLVKIIKSKKALPQIALILDNKSRLYTYIFINIAIFILMKFKSMVTKRRNKANRYYRKNFSDGVIAKLIIVLLTLAFRVGIFVFFFHKEAAPAWDIFRQTML